jgi:hypothetical protein
MSAGYNPARPVLFSGRPVRPLPLPHLACLGLAIALAAPAACVGTIESDPDLGGADPNQAGSPGLCSIDADCVLAAPTCCACPTFAVPIVDPVARACANVDCPLSECAENVIARCGEDRRCELACAPRACDPSGGSCAYGFAADAAGCLTCECAAPQPGGCTASTDCTRTREDCCGCQRGGFDTAVLVTEKTSHDAMLACPTQPACPEINTCTTDVPTCVQGRCELVSPSLPPGACGRADLPACPDGLQCLVNVNDQANMHGVGVCGEPP